MEQPLFTSLADYQEYPADEMTALLDTTFVIDN